MNLRLTPVGRLRVEGWVERQAKPTAPPQLDLCTVLFPPLGSEPGQDCGHEVIQMPEAYRTEKAFMEARLLPQKD